MNINRRSFLASLGGISFAIGLDGVAFSFVQDGPKGPEWFQAALKRMKEKGRLGLIVVTPAKPEDPAKEGVYSRDETKLGVALSELIDGEHPDAHEIFTGSVFVCLTPDLAALVGARKSDEAVNRILLDSNGKRLAADTVAVETFEDSVKFTESFEKFLHGEGLERLKERADAIRKNLGDDVKVAFQRLDADTMEARDTASATLEARAGELHELLVLERKSSASAEVRSRLRAVLEKHFQGYEAQLAGTRLPYGTRIPEFKPGGCGRKREVIPDEKDDGMHVACGMARASDEKVIKFLRFLTK